MASVFRKSAIEKLQSPDKLDCMLKVTTPMSWVGIMAAAFLTLSVLVWAFASKIPATVSANGFLVASYNTNTLFSDAAGIVSKIFVCEGSRVNKGDVVMTVTDAKGDAVDILSQQTGIVSSVLVAQGDSVTPNMELFRLSPDTDNPLSVVCYVDLAVSKQLKEGMEAGVYLKSSGSGTYGHMNAVITNIDNYVSSGSAMGELFGADGQMTYALTNNGPLVAVTCELEKDAASASGYYFSGGQMQDLKLTSGEQVVVQLVLNESAPISKVFPVL